MRAYQSRSIKLVAELYRLLIRSKVLHEYPIPMSAMTPVKAASETELSEGAITTMQTNRTELKWIIVGVINAPITSFNFPVNNPAPIDAATKVRPTSVPAAVPTRMKKSCHFSSVSMVTHLSGANQLST